MEKRLFMILSNVFEFCIKKGNSYRTIWILSYFLGAGAGFEIFLDKESANQKRTGSGNADFFYDICRD